MVKHHVLQVEGGDKTIFIPVVHVTNWPDGGALDAVQTQKLVNYINGVKDERINQYRKQNSRAYGDPNKCLPVIHCRAGVGRTGQLIAAMELMKNSGKSLQGIESAGKSL